MPDIDATTHAYVPAAPGCWIKFGELQAVESRRFGRLVRARRLVVDAYMGQHPGHGVDRRDRQSVFVHLAGLCAALERGYPPDAVVRLFRRLLDGRPEFPAIARGRGPGELTLLHMLPAGDLPDYDSRAEQWACAVWESWREHHDAIRGAIDRASG